MDDKPFAAWKAKCNEIMAAHLLPPEDLGEGAHAESVAKGVLAVADAAIAGRAPLLQGADAPGGGSYMLKATRWVLAQEAALLAGMREAAVARVALLSGDMDRS